MGRGLYYFDKLPNEKALIFFDYLCARGITRDRAFYEHNLAAVSCNATAEIVEVDHVKLKNFSAAHLT
jgi:hypothetical protein